MKVQCLRALQKSPLLLLGPEEVELGLECRRSVVRLIFQELFPPGAWRSRKVMLQAAFRGAYLCPGSEPVTAG